MINSILLASLRHAEYLQFSKDVLQLVQRNNPAGLSVQGQYYAFQTITTEIESLFAQDQASEITELVQKLDQRRDDAIIGIALHVEAMTHHFDLSKRQAAMRINHQLGLFAGGIARQNYNAETASIDKIIKDWNTQAEFQSAVAILDLADWKNELLAANNEFNQQYLLRTQQIGAQNQETFKAKRLESANLYYALRDRIDAYAVIGGGIDPWAKAIKELNALIAQYNSLIAGRASSPDSAEQTPQPQA